MASIKISRYVIIKELGRGGMATVYLVRDQRDNQVYALKVLPRQFTHDPMFRDRFARESKIVSQLNHEAIIPVYDFGEENQTPYMVMRYMPGGTLADRMAHGRMSRQEAVRILRPIAAALDYAHQRGIVHRDIKPGNIFFDERNNAFLGDFGVVKLAEATRSFSGTSVIGTPAYMSPEQVKGGGKIDGRSDIYALAIVLFELLTGKAPYQADTPTQQMMMHVLEPAPRISEQLPQVEPALEQILIKALAKEPDARYRTASDFIQAVDTLTPPPQATVYGPATRRYSEATQVQTPKPAQQRPVMILAGLVTVGVCAILGFSLAAASYFGFPGTAQVTETLATAVAVLQSPEAEETAAVLASPTQVVFDPLATVTPLPLISDTPPPTQTSPPTATRPPARPAAPPVAQHDSVSTAEDTPVHINPAANDSDPDGNLNTGNIHIVHPPEHGRVQPGGGSVTYTPDQDFNGQDRFTYQICDMSGQCAQAQVSIDVQPVNDPPAAADDSFNGTGGQPINVSAASVLDNDRDADGNPLTVRLQNNASNGSVALNPDGSFTYTPNGNNCSADRFTYLADDGQGGTDEAAVDLQITCADVRAIDVNLSSANPPSGSTLNPSSQINVRWNYTNNSYAGSFIFWKVELKLYSSPDCTGPQPRQWGEAGWWERSRAVGANGSSGIDVQVEPSFMVFAPDGQNIGYVAVHVSAFARNEASETIGPLIVEDEDFCFPYR